MATSLSSKAIVNAQKNAVFRRLEVRRQGGSDSDGSSGLSDLEVPNKMISMSTMGGKNRMFTPARKRSSKKLGQPSPLKTLQPLARSQSTLVGTNGFIRLCDSSMKKGKRKQTESEDGQCKQSRSKILKSSKVLGAAMIYEDPKIDTGTEKKVKSLAEEAIEMMTSEPVPESYWKELAEERRKALEEALKENEQLHGKVEELKTEIMRLSELAGQTEYFASIIKELMDEREKDESSDENEACSADETNEKVTENTCSSDSDGEKLDPEEEEAENDKVDIDSSDESSEEETVKLNPLQQPQFNSDSDEQSSLKTDSDVDSS